VDPELKFTSDGGPPCLVNASAAMGRTVRCDDNFLGVGLLAAGVGSLLGLGACGLGSPPSSTTPAARTSSSSSSGTSGEKIPVVASTNVWGNIAQVVGGDALQVTSIISDPEQDPHSYQANTQVVLQLSKAKLVIENGGGYDDFVNTMLKSSRNTPTVLNAVTLSGFKAPAGGGLNEHVWYSFPSVKKIADRIAAELGKTDPGQAGTFAANVTKFNSQLDQLISSEAQLKSKYAGEGVGITEPVPLYLLDAVGLVNETPAAFSEAVEEGDDVSAAVLKETLDLYTQEGGQGAGLQRPDQRPSHRAAQGRRGESRHRRCAGDRDAPAGKDLPDLDAEQPRQHRPRPGPEMTRPVKPHPK
jgi:zinc/manganese transport system substrate-binding protein